ncbi:MAG: hypothetical protein E6672_02320, partial [Negativicoccus succinicivorans]|nr:hypothetical protein [Negativicoccus succinicivorans]
GAANAVVAPRTQAAANTVANFLFIIDTLLLQKYKSRCSFVQENFRMRVTWFPLSFASPIKQVRAQPV